MAKLVGNQSRWGTIFEVGWMGLLDGGVVLCRTKTPHQHQNNDTHGHKHPHISQSGAAFRTETRTELVRDAAQPTVIEFVLRVAAALKAKPKGCDAVLGCRRVGS